MKNMIKRCGTILLGFAFLKAFDIFAVIFTEDKTQFIFKVICLVGALLSFFVAIVTDEKLKPELLKRNKWIMFSVYLSIVVMCIIIIFAIIGHYFA